MDTLTALELARNELQTRFKREERLGTVELDTIAAMNKIDELISILYADVVKLKAAKRS